MTNSNLRLVTPTTENRTVTPQRAPTRSSSVLAHCGQGCVIQTRLHLPERLLDAYKEGVALMLFLLVIVVRPEGLLGKIEERKV